MIESDGHQPRSDKCVRGSQNVRLTVDAVKSRKSGRASGVCIMMMLRSLIGLGHGRPGCANSLRSKRRCCEVMNGRHRTPQATRKAMVLEGIVSGSPVGMAFLPEVIVARNV